MKRVLITLSVLAAICSAGVAFLALHVPVQPTADSVAKVETTTGDLDNDKFPPRQKFLHTIQELKTPQVSSEEFDKRAISAVKAYVELHEAINAARGPDDPEFPERAKFLAAVNNLRGEMTDDEFDRRSTAAYLAYIDWDVKAFPNDTHRYDRLPDVTSGNHWRDEHGDFVQDPEHGNLRLQQMSDRLETLKQARLGPDWFDTLVRLLDLEIRVHPRPTH
jgi:hypothetical protein